MQARSVLVDGLDLSGSADRGIGSYLRHVLVALAERSDLALTVLVERDTAVPAGVGSIPLHHRLGRRLERKEHELRLPLAIARAAPDVFWSPAQAPPARVRMPWVQTLHDLTPLTFPHPLLVRDARYWRRVGRRLRTAAAVITPSRWTADQALGLLGVEPARVHVVPHGVDAAFSPEGPVISRARPYVLCVSAWGPHKGFAEAAAAIALLAAADYPHELVIVGRNDPGMLAALRMDLARGGRPDRVHVAGFVKDLPAWYRGADVVLVASRAEGFGFPVLEAQACGTAVVAAPTTSLPEVVGDAGVLADDASAGALAFALRRVLDDKALRAELVGRGLARAGLYDWAKSAAAHAEILLRAC